MLDTNRYRDVLAGVSEARRIVGDADEVFIPFVVMAELHTGFRKGNRRAKNEAELALFSAGPGVHVLYADAETIDIWADLNAALLIRGRKLPHNDVWIAACCVQHELPIYTRDRHFEEVARLKRV